MHAAEFRRCLDELDIAGVRAMWAHVEPNMPQPASDHEALATLHRARTEARSIALEKRAYSHRWLLDRGYPSGLPDILKPRAERLYPRIVDAVGIAVDSLYPEVAAAVRGAMSDAVEECYAEGVKDPAIIKSLMMERRERARRKLFGRRREINE